MDRKTTHVLHLLLVVLVVLVSVVPATPALAAIPIENAASSHTLPPVGEDRREIAPSIIPPTTPVLTGTVGAMMISNARSGREGDTPTTVGPREGTTTVLWRLAAGATLARLLGLDLGEPISANAGAYYFDLPLLSLGGPMNLHFTLIYGSDFQRVTRIGLPWSRFWWSPIENIGYDHAPDPADSYVTAQVSNGDWISFKWENDQWVPTEMNDFGYEDNIYPTRWLLQETTAYFYLLDPVGERVHIFYKVSDSRARIARIVDRNSNQLIYTYPDDDLFPSRVEDGLGRSLDLTYQTVGTDTALATVTDQAGRQVSLTHEEHGADNDNVWTLRSVTDSLGQTTTFHYTTVQLTDPFPFMWCHLITRMDRPAGNVPYSQTYEKQTLNGNEMPCVTSSRTPTATR